MIEKTATSEDWGDADVIALDPQLLTFCESRTGDLRRELIQIVSVAYGPDADPVSRSDGLQRLAMLIHPVEWADPWDDPTGTGMIFHGAFDESSFNNPNAKRPPDGPILAVRPQELDPRVTQQHSRFTIHGRNEAIDQLAVAWAFLWRFQIPAVHRKPILLDLFRLGTSRLSLFPDLATLGEELSRYGRLVDW